MTGFRKSFEQIWQTYSGEAAWQMVVDLCRFHRIQASPGYRQAAQLLHQRLVEDGLQAEIVSLPADKRPGSGPGRASRSGIAARLRCTWSSLRTRPGRA